MSKMITCVLLAAATVSAAVCDGAEVKSAQAGPQLYMAGDSIMRVYPSSEWPQYGWGQAKALYMFIKPGEYANYPKGKQDAAHVRDSGAFFYAKAAVEMAHKQGLSLADFWKDPAKVPFVPCVVCK